MNHRHLLLAGTALAAVVTPALADDGAIEKRLDAMQRTIADEQRQIEAQRAEIAALRAALMHKTDKDKTQTATAASAPDPQQAAIDARLAQLETAETQTRDAVRKAPAWSLAGGRPTVTSADGRFSFAIRAIGQYDMADYMQGASAQRLGPANGPDLSSGGNFRRAQLGVQGKVFGDWSYFFNYDFAGSGTEASGHIQQAYIEYDGFAPFALRIGAFPPSAGLEDNTGSADTIFLERNSPSDVARNIAGGDGRDGIGAIYAGSRVYGALTYTGDKVQDSGAFDEQQAVVGRLSGLLFSDADTKFVLSGNGSYVFDLAQTAAGPNVPEPVTLSDPPELAVDNTGTKLVSTGSIDARHVWEWGIESAAAWRSLYGQAGYFRYGVDWRTAPVSSGFMGWYAQGTWVLTGENRVYNVSSAAFSNPKPAHPFARGDGWGAWEIAARYSDLDLNDDAGIAGMALSPNGIRGGEQRIWTLGLNWYPASTLKFELQYQNVDIDRLGTIPASAGHAAIPDTPVGQGFDTLALRSQIAF